MNLQHVRAMARKEWWHLLRDPRSLAMILLMPLMLLFLFGYAVRLDIDEAPIGVLQESRDAQSDEIVARFDASHAFQVVARFHDRQSLRTALQAGKIWAGLVVPHDYAKRLSHHDAVLQLLLDGVDANTARLLRNYATALVNDYALSLSARAPPIRIENRSWFNEADESRLAIVPGVIAIVMAVIGALMTSLTIAREIEYGNLVMLRTTPLTRGEFLAGKLFPYFFIGMADLLLAVGAAVYVFDVPLRGSLTALALVSAVFVLVVMVQGALISMLAGNQMLASQISLISTFLPAFLLSGFIFAIDNMPVALQYLTYVVPARYYVALSKLIFLKGVSPLLVWTEVAALLAMSLLLMRIAFVRSRRLGLLP
jgi:drug efflux transport system permease protein